MELFSYLVHHTFSPQDLTSVLSREYAIKIVESFDHRGSVGNQRDLARDPRFCMLERDVYQDWCFRTRHHEAGVVEDTFQVDVEAFAINMMRHLQGFSVVDAKTVAQAVFTPPRDRVSLALTRTYQGVAMRVVCEYIIVRLVLRLQSYWRGLRARRAVAAHIHVLHFLGISRHRFDRCDALTNDLIKSFVGKLLV